MTEYGYFDPDGNPITPEEWQRRWKEEPETRIYGQDDVGANLIVQTVYIGFVYPLVGAHLFASALLRNGAFAKDLDYYDDKETALRRHAELVEELRSRDRRRWKREARLRDYVTHYGDPRVFLPRLAGTEWGENWRSWPHCNGEAGCWMHCDPETRWCRCRCGWCWTARRIFRKIA